MSSSQDDYKMSENEKVLLRLRQIHGGIALPMVIKTAVELGFFEFMANTPGAQFSCFDLASILPKQTQETPALVERILWFLAGHSILTSTVVKDENGEPKKLYGMTGMSNSYVRNQDGTSHASGLLLMYDKVLVDSWYHLRDALVEGATPFDKAHGMKLFQYAAKDNRFNEVFNKCMYDTTRTMMKMLLEKYKGFEGIKELVDVGGGLGANLELIIGKYPYIKGINFDLPHVIKNAALVPGVEHVGGDMFKSIPKGDAILMKGILHDWGDNSCIKILRNCWEALPESGKVVVVELIMPNPESDSTFDEIAKWVMNMDMAMMVHLGGKERTIKEYNILANDAGFNSVKIVANISMLSIVEFYKKSLSEII